ncbi:von Willebrand factor type A domain protein [Brevundimonas sp. SH203]|uniref:VWA domain-containing protein n=1 Tax=Brevundimonas sp. SH203 TaxID=345167 RepID=UPI0009CEEEF2|nr:VWA domain-containing protein [Brevundimonas sp. SH203]GAW39655.1 von Willebrand factor type A domain protein [Brevundimonas sp. SH203]
MHLTFLHPEAGWLLLLAAVFVWFARRAPRVRLALRVGIFLVLIAALAQPSLIYRGRGAPQVFVVDQGASLSPEARRQAAETVRAAAALRRGQGPVTLIQRGGAPLGIKADHVVTLPDAGDGGSLTQALTRALDVFPQDGGRITVIGDGLGGGRDWGRVVDGLLARGIAVDVLPLATARREAFIAGAALSLTGAGERTPMRVRLEGVGQGLTLTIFDGERQVAAAPAFDMDGSRIVTLDLPGARPGFRPLRLELSRQGAVISRYETTAAVQEPLAVLYANGRTSAGGAAMQRLAGYGLRVDQRRPGDLAGADLGRYRAVMLDDVPAGELSSPAMTRLLDRVRDGGLGLIVSGGDAAFASGGYAGTPLAAALPVTLRQDEVTEDPSVALAVVIDTSGSMLGKPLDLGKQIARLAVRKLTPADTVGVVEFYGGRQWVAPMQPARDIPEVERAIGRVQAQGGSEHLFDALQEAYYGLKNTQARYRHILVISDAGVAADRYPQLIRHIADDQVTVSTVLVGGSSEGEARMAQWARLGRGRFYVVNDEFSLVEINLKQPRQKPEPATKRGAYALTASGPAYGWSDLTTPAPPALNGYAQSGVRPLADTLLKTAGGEPILATWQWGAGRVTALMTEPVGDGTASWRGWSGYGDWMRRLVGRTADARPEWDVRLGRVGDQTTVVAQAVRASGDAAPTIRLIGSDGVAQALTPVQRAPGLFSATARVPSDAPVRVEVSDAAGVVRAALGARDGGDPTRPPSEADALPLEQLSALTGGRVVEQADQMGDADGRGRALTALDLWGWLCWLALALYLADIVYRRWPAERGRAGVRP